MYHHRTDRVISVSGLLLSLVAALALTGQMACTDSASHRNIADTPAIPTVAAAAEGASSLPVAADHTADLAGLQDSFDKIARQVAPSVVAISALAADPARQVGASRAPQSGPNAAPQLSASLERVSRTVGTGFIVDPDGYIVTDHHVVADAVQIWVTADNKQVYPAMVVGSDPRSDLAVLKIPATGLQAVRFANAASVRRGQWALTLGNPYGLATSGEMAVSVGVVSATNRSLPKLSSSQNRLYTDLIQTTAEINPGNSGGPLFNLQGEVIGVNAAVVLPQKNTNGIGFAFAISDELLGRINRLKAGEPIIHPYLGIAISAGDGGVNVDSLTPGSPAVAAGLAADDMITQINGARMSSTDVFIRTIADLPVGKPAKIEFLRDGKLYQASATPIPWPSAATLAISRTNQRLFWAGMLIGPAADGHGYAVQSINAESPYAQRGIKPGSIIVGVSGKDVTSLLDLQAILTASDPQTCQLNLAAGRNPSVAAGATLP